MLQSRNDVIEDLFSYHNMYVNTSSHDKFTNEGASLRYNTLRRLCYRICWYTMMMDGNINFAVLRHDMVLKFFWSNSNTNDYSLSKQKIFNEQREQILSLKNDNKYMYQGTLKDNEQNNKFKHSLLETVKIPKHYKHHIFNGTIYVDIRRKHICKDIEKSFLGEVMKHKKEESIKSKACKAKRNILNELDAETIGDYYNTKIVKFGVKDDIQKSREKAKSESVNISNKKRETQNTLLFWKKPVEIWDTNKKMVNEPNHRIFINLKPTLKNPLPFHKRLDALFPTIRSRQTLEYYITRIKCHCNLPKRLYISKSNKYYYGCHWGNYPTNSCDFFCWYEDIHHGKLIFCDCNNPCKKKIWKEKIAYTCCHYKSKHGCSKFHIEC